MLNKLGYTKIEMAIVIVLLGIVSFITINSTSYAFSTNNNADALKEVKSLIEFQAEEYALENIEELFKDSKTTFITVATLAEARPIVANSEGLVTDPTDSTKNYNDNKIKLEYDVEKNTVSATFVE